MNISERASYEGHGNSKSHTEALIDNIVRQEPQ